MCLIIACFLRLILCAENIGRVILPLRSRCLLIRVPAPSSDDVVNVVRHLNKIENLNVSDALSRKFTESCNHNLRSVLLNLQTQRLIRPSFTDEMDVQIPEWRKEIDKIASSII